ncbi:uncharacterized protein LOC103316324 [Nasonia vitripennis]|uniref:Uncharacterized protein n=1 Tax=Nasonia vitripennis TaxID=7425 RepID=A0A7M7HB61_NASVI|nr:uncharacterized protein LOC103316324 [Nasonia vitripennis]
MWADLIGNQLIEPWKLPHRLNGPNYLQFLQEDLPGLLDAVLTPEEQENIIFMHDGVPAHFAIDVHNYLYNIYPDRWIGRGGPIPLAVRSPDLNALDYFFWGYAIKQM